MKKKLEEDGTESFEEETLTSKFREAGINIISIHTAQDVCKGGNADVLVDLFEMTNTEIFAHTTGEFGAGRIGQIQETSSFEFVKSLEAKLNTRIVRTNKYFKSIKKLKSIAILPGSGTQFLDEVITKADVFITGDISHRYLSLIHI